MIDPTRSARGIDREIWAWKYFRAYWRELELDGGQHWELTEPALED